MTELGWRPAALADPAPALPAEVCTALAAIAKEAIGLVLGEDEQSMVWNRLAPRLAELGGLSFAEYLTRVRGSVSERQIMVELLCTHETRFFREPGHFEWIATSLAPGLRAAAARGRRPRRFRAWSAACSTGDEPFTLAMVLRDALPIDEGWAIEIVATDVSRAVLARAAEATWPIERADAIPPDLLRRHMLRGFGDHAGTFRARPELRALIAFRQHNLLDRPALELGDFDLVLCRNVLIYFQRGEHARLVGHLLERVPLGGHLIVGHAESLTGLRPDLQGVAPTVYVHQHRPRRASRRG